MNNIDTLHSIYMVSLTAAIIMAVITIVLFFVFDIRHIIGRIFGFTERKAVKQKQMEASTIVTSQLNNKYNKKMKDKVFTNTGSLKRNQTPVEMLGINKMPALEEMYQTTESLEAAAAAYGMDETTSLDMSETQTAVLKEDESDSQTTVLSDNAYEPQTTVLSSGAVSDLQFMIIKQIIMIHTDESIEIN